MAEKVYRLSEQEIKNLRIFLNRVEIRGSEATALTQILLSLSRPLVIEMAGGNIPTDRGSKIPTPPSKDANAKPTKIDDTLPPPDDPKV